MEDCNCVSAAARYRCPHFVYPNCHKDESQPKDLFEKTGFGVELGPVDSDIPVAKKTTFQAAWAAFSKDLELLEQSAAKKKEAAHRKDVGIIETHYGVVNALKADWGKEPLLRAWQEMSIAFVVLLTMPYMFWLFIRNPEGSHKLPFVD